MVVLDLQHCGIKIRDQKSMGNHGKKLKKNFQENKTALRILELHFKKRARI